MTPHEIKSEARRIVFEYLNVLDIDYRHSDAKKAIKCAIKHYEEMSDGVNRLMLGTVDTKGYLSEVAHDRQIEVLNALKLMLAEFKNGLE